MSFGFPELASIRLGYGLSPLMPPPADAAAVLARYAGLLRERGQKGRGS